MRNLIDAYRFLSENLKGKKHLFNLSEDGKIILK
jgi:hypothetical protein